MKTSAPVWVHRSVNPGSVKVKDELVKAWIGYRGNLYTQRNFGEAISAFQQTFQLSPSQLDAYVGLAKSFFKKGDFAEVLQAARKALSLEPGNGEVKKLLLQMLRGR